MKTKVIADRVEPSRPAMTSRLRSTGGFGSNSPPEELSQMGLLELILRPRTSRQLQRLSVQVADRCLDAVRARLNPMAYAMTPAEARGYVRARAAAVVSREVDLAVSMEGRLPAWGRHELMRQATSHVVLQLGSELVSLPPSEVRRLRRAA